MEFIIAAIVCFAVYWVGYAVGRTYTPKVSMTRGYTITFEGKQYDVSERDFHRIALKRVYARGSLPEALWQALRAGNYEVTDWITTVRK